MRPALVFSDFDVAMMRSALMLAAQGLGRVAPNPSVGCVIVDIQGRVVGAARTADGGRPHAETQALEMAGERARGGTCYVTLEPCAHHGKTPPCAEALLHAGVSRVVIACHDPDPRVAGQGANLLRLAGVTVNEGLLAEDGFAVNKGFFLRFAPQPRPFVTLKIASTLDGKIATQSGESQWITGAEARAAGHGLRLRHDAILIGKNTYLADNPSLSCRLGGIAADDAALQPLPVILDRGGGCAQALVNHQFARTPLLVTNTDAVVERHVAFDVSATGTDIPDVLAMLAARGVTRLLVEGGAGVIGSFLRAGMDAPLWDELWWFQAPSLIGGDGLQAVHPLNINSIKDVFKVKHQYDRPVGADMLRVFTHPLA